MKLFDVTKIGQIKSGADKLLSKSLNRHIKLAVTGLSRSGKSAFITSLVHQLCNQADSRNMPFVEVIREERFIGCRKTPQTSLHIPSFHYQEALDSLFSSKPHWPKSTRSISELHLTIRYRPAEGLLSYLSEMNTLHIDIVDYPGEWLMDLPMLSMDYLQWSKMMADLFAVEPRKSLGAAFIEKMAAFDVYSPLNETLLAELAQEYSELLISFKNEHGLNLLQPGRFILPGELEGAPILQFVPLITNLPNSLEDIDPDSNLAALRNRFEEYKRLVVKAFYNDYFRNFDRQIVLVDCLSPLNAGAQSFIELQRSLEMLLQSYSYGKNSLLRRMFAPRIDKLLFAATKADHVTPDQHHNLTQLLNNLIDSARKDIQFEGITIDTVSMSSIQATESGVIKHQGKEHLCIKGTVNDPINGYKTITVYPGDVPTELPDKNFWEDKSFDFISFEPPYSAEHRLSHIRMDRVIEFLLGDKMR